MVLSKEQKRLLSEMMGQCKTNSWALAACFLLAELWAKDSTYQRKDELLHALLVGFQTKQDQGWCYTTLHLALYPKLSFIRSKRYQYSWSEIHSALDQAIGSYNLEQTSKVAGNLAGLTLSYLSVESRIDAIEAEIATKIIEAMQVFSLAEVFSGESRHHFTKEECQRALHQFEILGLVKSEDSPKLLERFFPVASTHSPKDRQNQTRAVRRLRKKLKKTGHKRRRGTRNR